MVVNQRDLWCGNGIDVFGSVEMTDRLFYWKSANV